jgi:hypothetical protein
MIASYGGNAVERPPDGAHPVGDLLHGMEEKEVWNVPRRCPALQPRSNERLVE